MSESIEVVTWALYFANQAQKDSRKIAQSELRPQVDFLLDILRKNPFQNPPPYEKLVGNLQGAYSRRINSQHRLVYQVLKKDRAVKIIRLWAHYE